MSMKIKVTIDSVVTEVTEEATAREIAKRFGVIVEITGKHSPAGMEMSIIGRPYDIVKMMTADNGGWSTDDDEEDAENLYYLLKSATEVYSG